MSRATLSIGSNLGDRRGHLAAAVAALGNRVTAVSAVYETAPWGPVEQNDYLNAVVVAEDSLTARGWLERAWQLERAASRVRDVQWGPRTLDVDVVQVIDDGEPVRASDPELTLPHPRAHERAFVLIPWAEADPTAVLAGRGPVSDLVAGLDPAERAGVRRRDELALVVAP